MMSKQETYMQRQQPVMNSIIWGKIDGLPNHKFLKLTLLLILGTLHSL